MGMIFQREKQMKKRRFPWRIFLIVLFLCAGVLYLVSDKEISYMQKATSLESLVNTAGALIGQEPEEVRKLREQTILESDEGHQEYYFSLLDDKEKRVYREMLHGIRNREPEFYLTSSEDGMIDKVYHAVLKDHPELFWIHNRHPVYRTTYPGKDYCTFSPGYTYTEEEIREIQKSVDYGYQEIISLIPDSADDYEKVKTVYTYLIDTVDYVSTEHDQNIAGVFWKKEAVCAGYARAVLLILEKLGIPCIYVEGDTRGSVEGHAWNIVQLNGQYYYVDATNGDQPEFLEGDAVEIVEHKTTLYDYLCPFPDEYNQIYTASSEFPVPQCTETDKNFYVMNDGCFDMYDRSSLYDYCQMRLDNGAAVVRFKFSSKDAYNQAYREWIQEGYIDHIAEYYLQLYGLNSIEYHYGILENMNTMYFMF